jgi:hypothetical protein
VVSIKKKNMTQIIDMISNYSENQEFFDMVREEKEDLLRYVDLLISLPPGLASHILDYAESVEESDESNDSETADSDFDRETHFLDTDGWEGAGDQYDNNWEYSTEVRIPMASQMGGSWAYILSFEVGQKQDPKVWIEDHRRNRQFQPSQTLIVCSEIDVWDMDYLKLVDRGYDLAAYETEEYVGWEFTPYFNIYEDMTWEVPF